MKKAIFFMVIVTTGFISCTTTNLSTTSKEDYYQGNPYAQPYINDSSLISGPQAEIYIHSFKKHKYRDFHKKKLNVAWSTFDTAYLHLACDSSRTDSVYFFLAAYPKRDTTVHREKKRHPFIIMQVIPKPGNSETVKGGANSLLPISNSLYFLPRNICPPPNNGCSIP
jgi:hypothetical protein